MTDTLMLRSDDVRQRFTVVGVVQGVGFRPFVHRIATELGLVGFVGNDSGAVFIEVQGPRRRPNSSSYGADHRTGCLGDEGGKGI